MFVFFPRSVSWFNEETSKGIQIDFPSIVMHAVANTEDYGLYFFCFSFFFKKNRFNCFYIESLKVIGTKMIYCQLDSTVANDNNDDDEELPQVIDFVFLKKEHSE